MKEILRSINETGLVRITGSYADGTNNSNSDIDFYVKPDLPDTPFNKRNILKIIKVLDEYKVKWDSSITGYIFTHKMNMLDIQLEFSDLFKPRKNKLSKVIIQGIEFNTY